MMAVLSKLMFFLLMVASGTVELHAQNIPIGTWRLHISFHSLVDVVVTPGTVYAAASNGVMLLDRQEQSVEVYHKGNGLNNTGIRRIAYDATTRQLVVAYSDGTFDVVQENRVRFFDPTRNAVLTGSKAINDITVAGTLAYLATDYGVLVYDLARAEIKETWRDLGEGGATIKVSGTAIRDDSVFLATESGVMAGNLSGNLLDFNKWERFPDSNLPFAANSIAAVGTAVYAAFTDNAVFEYSAGSWRKIDLLPDGTYFGLSAAENQLLLTNGVQVWKFNPAGIEPAVVYTSPEGQVVKAASDDSGILWIAGRRSGLLTNVSGTFSSLIPNGPAFDKTVALQYHDNKISAAPGGFAAAYEALNNPGTISVFGNGVWSAETLPVSDITSVVFNETGTRFVGSFGFGVIESRGGEHQVWDETNSSLVNVQPSESRVNITALADAGDGLWVANYGVNPSLHFYNYGEGGWESFSFPYNNSPYPTKLESDDRGNVWVAMNPESGGGLMVLNKTQNEHAVFSTQPGQGGLPSNRVFEVVNDRDGNVWIGTDAGVAYFFDKGSDAVRPIFENRFLLRDETIRAIAVDGGNRKWIGTERGVWLFSPTGEEALVNFTAANSPLPSDRVLDIEIDPGSGEVFFATDRGVASFRSNATAGQSSFQPIRIFPNPVSSGFTGEVGITGLATDAVVKITDISGRLIRETRANGGSASWNVRDSRGNRVDTGIYLVMAVAVDGSESIVGKIAVVN